MKLCHIVPSLEPHRGGPSKSVPALCTALARLGHEVELFATAPGADAKGETREEANVRITVFRRDWPQRLCPSSGLRRAIRQNEADIVHHHSLWLRSLHYAHGRGKMSGTKLVISPRGMMSAWAWRHHRWQKTLARLLVHPGALPGAAGWHATSAEEETEIRTLGFPQNVCVAPNGVDAPSPAETEIAAAHWREVCPEVARRPVALFYSRFHQKKRVIELIDLWLESAPKDWLLLLVGIPEDYTPEMLNRYVLRMSGSGRIRAYSGAGQPAPYAIASLFLLPSHNENFGLVVAEAMAHGLPVVVTDTTPWRAVNDEHTGWCVPWENYGATLASATTTPPDELRDRGQKARAWVLREFSWDRAAMVLSEFYVRLKGATS
jgi:glycosyltransferase involved in cell wall biosynthesis